MRPWEYWAMDAEDFHLITALKAAYEEGRDDAKAEASDVEPGHAGGE